MSRGAEPSEVWLHEGASESVVDTCCGLCGNECCRLCRSKTIRAAQRWQHYSGTALEHFVIEMLSESSEVRLRRDAGVAAIHLWRSHPKGGPQGRACSPQGVQAWTAEQAPAEA